MTKTKQQKEAKKAARRAEMVALAQNGQPGAAVTQGLSRIVGKAAKKQSKKSGSSSWWGVLAGAAKMAAELAPSVVPLLLAKHAPTAAMVGGASAQPAVGAAVASPVSCATCTGLYECSAIKGKDGRVIGMKMRGLDYLGALNCDSEVAGTTLSEISLNPLDPAWSGTQMQRFATLFERYRPSKVVGLVEPSCPSTTPGQIIGYMDPDPDDDLEQTGRPAIQIASSHQGADISQVWGVNAAAYAFDQTTQDFYADADGSDARLISPGTWRVLANTDMPADTPLGSLYVAWEYLFRIPQLEEFSPGGDYGMQAVEDATGSYPFGDQAWDPVVGELEALLGVTAGTTASTLSGLDVGEYFATFDAYTSDATSAVTWTITGDANGVYTALDGTPTIVAVAVNPSVGTEGQFNIQFAFRVNKNAFNFSQGGLTASYTAVGGSTLTSGYLRLFQVKPASAMTRMTLKDFEKRVLDMDVKLQRLTEQLMADRAARDGGLPYSTAVPPRLKAAASRAASAARL